MSSSVSNKPVQSSSAAPDASSPDGVWRVFYTRARAEKKCETRLQDRGIDVLVPKKTEIRQWSDRKKKVT
ncbi:MAG: transcription termination/antitermination NusG family protein, partial [Salinivenus sp.]